MSDTRKFLLTTDWEYKNVTDNQINIKTCPICGDNRWKFYIEGDKGLWDCKICGENGNLYQLKSKLGKLDEIASIDKIIPKQHHPLEDTICQAYENNLRNDKAAYTYLKSRGFTDETIKHFRLGVDNEWITIPHFQDGKLWNFKKRNYLKKGFKRIPNQPTVIFNIDNIDETKPTIVIVESETDCIAAWQMGLHNVVGLTAGAETFKPEWIPFFRKFKKIFVCLNSDDVGQKGAYKVAEKIGLDKCVNVILPVKDVNDYLKEHTKEEFINEFGKAQQFNLKNVSGITEYIDSVDSWFDKDGLLNGLHLNYLRLDSMLEGFKEEDLIFISGDSGVGKTTFVLNTLYQFLEQGHRCMSFFLEGKIMYYLLRMMSVHTQTKYQDLRELPNWEDVKKHFANLPMFFYSGAQCDMTPNKFKELLLSAVKLYDIEFVVLDNLQKLVKTEDVRETGVAVSILKDLAVDLKIPILVISHVRKPSTERTSKRVSMYDAKSSSTIYQAADVYICIWNNKDIDADDDDIIVTLEKNRMGEGGKDISFIFDKTLATYRERPLEFDKIARQAKKQQKTIERIGF